MSNLYQEACERHARVLRELEEEEQQSSTLPQQQRSSEALVFKTFETPAPQPRQEDQWAAWNAWADNRIEKFLDENLFTENQREVLGYVIADLRKYTREHVDEKLGELRAEIEILRGVVKSSNVELIKRSKDVA